MPVRRRASRRKVSATLEQWACYLEFGHDYFSDLSAAGVDLDAEGRPSIDDARDAWESFAVDLMYRWRTDRRGLDYPAWAIEQFGEPSRGGIRRCR